MLLVMLTRRRGLVFAPFLFLFLACSQSSAQGPKDADSLRRELDALKAQQAEMQRSLDEIREFLKAATGGRFGAPSLVNSTFDTSGMPSNGKADAPLTCRDLRHHCPSAGVIRRPASSIRIGEHRQARHVFGTTRTPTHPAPISARVGGVRQRSGRFWDLHSS